MQVREEVNQLDKMFYKISEDYSSDFDYEVQLFNNLLEPMLIVFLALIVGIILVAMYLPIFKLSEQFI